MKRVLLLAALVASTMLTFAQETKYKSLFIYNFTKHIGWPANDKSGDFVIGVVADNQIYNTLQEITQGKMAGSQKIVVKYFKEPEEINSCHILFVAARVSGENKFNEILSRTQGTSTLIVTERSGLAEKGSTINFVIQEGKMKFELNNSKASESNLVVSNYLKSVAINI